MPTVKDTFDAILFDMDGTLTDSTKAVSTAWTTFLKGYPELNVDDIVKHLHGVRTVDILSKHCGITDPDELKATADRFEAGFVSTAKSIGPDGIILQPGVAEIMKSIIVEGKEARWAICTSATRLYASDALELVRIRPPPAFVCAEDIENGKPAPDPFLLGAQKCQVDPSKCLVIEDAPAGLRSGQAAGCKTLGVTTSHTREQMEAASPTYLVKNLASVQMHLTPEGRVEVTMEQL